MSLIDNKSSTDVIVVFNGNLVADSIIYTLPIDVSGYDNGITFLPYVLTSGSGTTVAITGVQDSEDNMEYTDVPETQLIGDLSDFQFSAPVTDNEIINTLGVLGTFRYVRLVLTVTNHTLGVKMLITANGALNVSPELAPSIFYGDSEGNSYVDFNGDTYVSLQ